MASKLDYLKKYLAKPGQGSDGGGSVFSSGGKSGKPKATKEKSKRASDSASIRIRDMSEALPQPKAEKLQGRRRGDLGLGGSLAEEPDEDFVFVEKAEVDEKSKLDVETSGVAWRISKHRKAAPAAGLRGVAARAAQAKAPVRVVVAAGAGARGGVDSDLSPPRQDAPVSSRGSAGAPGVAVAAGADSDLSPPRESVKAAAKAEAPDSDDDFSPPRRNGAAASAAPTLRRPSAVGAKPEPADSDDDLSPPRRDAPATAAAVKPVRLEGPQPKAEPADSDDDLSPPRRDAPGTGAQAAGPRAKAEPADSDADFSPPRQTAATSSTARPRSDEKAQADSDGDFSPPRRGTARSAAATTGGAARRARHDSDDDLSPPRKGGESGGAEGKSKASTGKRARHDSDSDLSPPRRGGGDSGGGEKPKGAEKRARHDSDSDLSPPRRDGDGDGKSKEAAEEPERMSSGLRAGLVRGTDLKREAAEVRDQRKAALAAASDEQTGRNATTVYRNREGARIDREEWVQQQQKKKRKKLSDYPEQELEWGGGVKQKYNKEAEMAETERIAAQPFARYEPDEKYMEELKDRQDWNDPMRKFQNVDDGGDGGGGGGAGGSAAATAVAKPKPKCPHAPWPNRFNIPPGYRWDGKVRGTEYERKWLETKNHREHREKERWKWEMEEM